MSTSITENDSSIPAFVLQHLANIAEREGFQNFSIEENAGAKHGDGFMGSLLSITLDGQRNIDGILKSDKLALICKVLPQNTARQEQFNCKLVFQREVHFYKIILPILEHFQHENGFTEENGFFGYPQCYATASDEFIIIMKDLRSDGYSLWDKSKPIPIENVKLVMEQLGRLHGLSYALRDQRPEVFKEIQQVNDILMEGVTTTLWKGIFDDSYDQAIAVLQQNRDIEVAKMLKETWVTWLTECLQSNSKESFRVLGHGDLWNNNMMFSKTSNKVCLLDWQNCGFVSPVLDISTYLISSTEKTLRMAHYDQLIQIYYKNLSEVIRKCGSDVEKLFTFNDLQEEFQKFGKYGLYMAPLFLQVMVSDPSNIADFDDVRDDDAALKDMVKFDDKSKEEFQKRLEDAFEHARNYGWI